MVRPVLPEDIEGKEFLVSVRGYDRGEVQAFLREVAEHYRKALGGAPPEPESFEALGQEIGNILQAARESADAIVRDAQARSDALVKEAESEAEAIRGRLEQERGSVETAARGVRERPAADADIHVQGIRAPAEREATRQSAEVAARVEQLQETETKLRQRLYALQVIVQSLREDLESAVRGAPTPAASRPAAPGPEPSPAEDGSAPAAEEGSFLQRIMSSARRWSLL